MRRKGKENGSEDGVGESEPTPEDPLQDNNFLGDFFVNFLLEDSILERN